MLAYPIGQGVELVGVRHVKLEHGRRVGQPLRDPLDQRQPAEAGEHDSRAFLLRDPGHVESDRGVGQHSGDENPLAVE